MFFEHVRNPAAENWDGSDPIRELIPDPWKPRTTRRRQATMRIPYRPGGCRTAKPVNGWRTCRRSDPIRMFANAPTALGAPTDLGQAILLSPNSTRGSG